VKYGENILFGEVWRDPTLTSKERSLSTLSALISIGNTEQMPFYVGWPKASAALNIVAKQ